MKERMESFVEWQLETVKEEIKQTIENAQSATIDFTELDKNTIDDFVIDKLDSLTQKLQQLNEKAKILNEQAKAYTSMKNLIKKAKILNEQAKTYTSMKNLIK